MRKCCPTLTNESGKYLLYDYIVPKSNLFLEEKSDVKILSLLYSILDVPYSMRNMSLKDISQYIETKHEDVYKYDILWKI